MRERTVVCLGFMAMPLALVARVACAQPLALSVRYEAPLGCPDAEAFARAVAARTASRANGVVTIRIERADDDRPEHFAARVIFEAKGLVAEARDVDAARCDDVVAALAFITALALDGQASREAAASPANGPSPAVPERIRGEFGAGGALVGGFAPGLSPSALAFVDIAPEGHRPLRPEARIAGFYAHHGAIAAGVGAATEWLVGGRAEACAFRLGDVASVAPCLGGELAARHARGEGSSLIVAHAIDEPWAAASALARARWRPATEPRLSLGFDAALVVPLTRGRLYFEVPDATVYRTPPVAAALSVWAGMRFF